MNDRNSPKALAILPIGAKVQFAIATVPAVPNHIRSMDDVTMRQHAQDAWVTASTLRSVLELWISFQGFHLLGIGIDGTSNRNIAKLFPSLEKLASFLDAAATFKSDKSRELSSYPVGDWVDLYGAFKSLITSKSNALSKIGVNSPAFSQAKRVPKLVSQVMDGNFELSAPIPKFEYGRGGAKTAMKMIHSLTTLMDLLKTAPATALKVPKTTDASDQFKHSSDFVSVVWDGKTYTFARGHQAKSIGCLWRAWENKTSALAERISASRSRQTTTTSNSARFFGRKKSVVEDMNPIRHGAS